MTYDLKLPGSSTKAGDKRSWCDFIEFNSSRPAEFGGFLSPRQGGERIHTKDGRYHIMITNPEGDKMCLIECFPFFGSRITPLIIDLYSIIGEFLVGLNFHMEETPRGEWPETPVEWCRKCLEFGIEEGGNRIIIMYQEEFRCVSCCREIPGFEEIEYL